jgi:hypothetical protein
VSADVSVCFHPNLSTWGVLGKVYKGLTDLWLVVVCPKAKKEEWHVKKCLFSQCNQCGVKNLAFCPLECNGDGPKMVEWR